MGLPSGCRLAYYLEARSSSSSAYSAIRVVSSSAQGRTKRDMTPSGGEKSVVTALTTSVRGKLTQLTSEEGGWSEPWPGRRMSCRDGQMDPRRAIGSIRAASAGLEPTGRGDSLKHYARCLPEFRQEKKVGRMPSEGCLPHTKEPSARERRFSGGTRTNKSTKRGNLRGRKRRVILSSGDKSVIGKTPFNKTSGKKNLLEEGGAFKWGKESISPTPARHRRRLLTTSYDGMPDRVLLRKEDGFVPVPHLS